MHRQLFGRRLGQGPHGKLGRGVNPQQRITFVAGNGAGINDFALALECPELLCRRLNPPQGALNVDPVDSLHLLLGDIRQRLDLGDTRVVDHDVQPAQFVVGVINSGKYLFAVAHVGHKSGGFAPEGFHLFGDLRQLFRIEVNQCNIGTVLGQAQCNAAPDALCATRYQCNLSREFHSLVSFQQLIQILPPLP